MRELIVILGELYDDQFEVSHVGSSGAMVCMTQGNNRYIYSP